MFVQSTTTELLLHIPNISKVVKSATYRKYLSMFLKRTVAENDCSCGKCHKHYCRGDLLNKNVTSEIKF